MMQAEPFDPNELLALYREGPDRLAAAVAGLEDAQLDLAPGPASWSIRQIVHHVVDGDDLWQVAIKVALGNSGCPFDLAWYWAQPQDTWADRWCYAGRALEPSLALFRANRTHAAQLMDSVPGAWARCVVVTWPNGEQDRVTVRDVVDMQAGHTLDHAADILTIREQHGV